MGENTKIQWCDHTFNPWRGCTKVASGCANCYAEAQAKRNTGTLGVWGPNGTRVVAAESAWRQVERWDRESETGGDMGHDYTPSVFCGSMCDVLEAWQGEVVDSHNQSLYLTRAGTFDHRYSDKKGHREIVGMEHVRQRLFRLIDATPNLTWLLLTKRPENIRQFWPTVDKDSADLSTLLANHMRAVNARIAAGGAQNDPASEHVAYASERDNMPCRDNVYLGTSIACQEDADKNIPELLKCRDLCRGVFLSIEPLVGLIDFGIGDWYCPSCDALLGGSRVTNDERCDVCGEEVEWHTLLRGIDQVIIGGESGPNARPCRVEWVRSIVRQCEAAGVPCFVKQLGANVIGSERERYEMCGICIDRRPGTDAIVRWKLRDKKGGDPAEWPEDLRKYRSLAWKGGA